VPVDLVDVGGIAELLGVNRRTAWRYIDRDDFPAPAFEVSRKRLWRRRDVERWAKRTLPFPSDPRKGA